MTCTRPQAERQIPLATRASSTHDLFLGAWIARDAMRIGATYILTALCLLLTFLLGPLGLTIYLAYRWAGGHGTTLFETPPAERAA